MRSDLALLVIAAVSIAPSQARAFDYSFLPLGSDAKTHLGAGAVTSSDAPSLLYNPANLQAAAGGTELYGELSVVSLKHTYEMPGAGKTKLALTTPVPLLGASFRPASRWTFAFVGLYAPAGGPPVEAKDVPSRQLGEEPVFLDVSTDNPKPSSLVGVGVSFRALGNLALGLSAAHYQVRSRMTLTDSGSGVELGGIEAAQARTSLRLGWRWLPMKYLCLGGSFEPESATELTAEGTAESASSESVKGRRGARATLGVLAKVGAFQPYAELQAARSSDDHGSVLALMAGGEGKPSRRDTTSVVLGSHYVLSRQTTAMASAGWFPSPVRDGIMADRASDGEERQGAAFGDLDVVPRFGVGMGLGRRTSSGRISCGVARQWGARDVPESSRGYGRYALEVYYAGCEIGRAL